jgi:hypothetical protein
MFDKWHDWDWVRKGRDQLLITVGDSWTWGDSLGRTQSNVYDDREFRLSNVYGAQLADLLKADFINIAKPGESNLWISDHVHWAKQHIHELGYSKIHWVATLTEVGREFNGDRDYDRIYTELLKDAKTFDDFLACLSQEIARSFARYPDVVIGTNFVGNNYPKELNVLPQSWADLIAQYNQQSMPQPCTVMQSWVFERFDAAIEFIPNLDRTQWLQDVIMHMDRADQTIKMLLDSPLNYKKASKHPTPTGHKVWADYLLAHMIQLSN